MPAHATPQRSRSETQACPEVPAVLSIREEAALLRAAQAAGTISRTEAPTPEALDAFFACRRAEALKAVEQRWSLTFSEQGEPVPVAGGDWEWSIERQADGAQAGPGGDNVRAEAPLSPPAHTHARSHERPVAEAAGCAPGSPSTLKRRAGEADTSCGAQTREQHRLRLAADADVAPSLKAFYPAR